MLTAGLSPTMGPGQLIYDVDIVGPARVLAAFEPLAGDGSVAVLFASMAGHLVPDDAAIDAVLDRPLDPSFLDDLASAGIPVEDPSFAYALSKRAVLRLVRREAKAWGTRGARLLSLSPGIIDTPMGRAENEAQPVMADMVTGSALGRMIDADEVAAVVDFLVSPAASALTGTDVLVDGARSPPSAADAPAPRPRTCADRTTRSRSVSVVPHATKPLTERSTSWNVVLRNRRRHRNRTRTVVSSAPVTRPGRPR